MVTKTIDVQANSLSLEELITLLQNDTELVLVKDNIPVARMSPIPVQQEDSQPRIPSLNAGTLVYISDDFDDPLPDEFWLGSE